VRLYPLLCKVLGPILPILVARGTWSGTESICVGLEGQKRAWLAHMDVHSTLAVQVGLGVGEQMAAVMGALASGRAMRRVPESRGIRLQSFPGCGCWPQCCLAIVQWHCTVAPLHSLALVTRLKVKEKKTALAVVHDSEATASVPDGTAGNRLEKVEHVQAQNSDLTGVQQQE